MVFFDDWERQAWRPPPDLTIWEWAERDIILPRGVSARPGPMNISGLTPYLIGPLEAAADPQVEEMTMCFSTQMAKTTAIITIVLHTMSQNPWNCAHIMPRENDAVDICQDRYIPIIQESPALRGLFNGGKHEMTRDTIRANGMTISFLSANSPAALAYRSVALLVMDEVDKWPPWSGKEADPVKLARERTRTFPGRKIINVSTPTTEHGYILRELAASTDERYHVPCPHCGFYQEFIMGTPEPGTPGIKWPGDERNPEIIADNRLAYYECASCHKAIRDGDKPRMLRAGIWVPAGAQIVDGALEGGRLSRRHVGYKIWAAYSPFLTFSEIAAEFLRSKDYLGGLMNFRNSWQAEPWRVIQHEVTAAHLRIKRGSYRQGTSPGGWLLTVGVDVQSSGGVTYQYYVIRAWGPEGESWLVRAGRADDWTILHDIIFKSTYRLCIPPENEGEEPRMGDALPIGIVCIDEQYEKGEVHDFCLKFLCNTIVGAARPNQYLKTTQVLDKIGIKTNLVRHTIDTNFFKSELHRLIRSDRWHLPFDCEEEYFRQMTAEQLVFEPEKSSNRMRLVWRVQSQGQANHLFDCECYALVGAHALGLQHRREAPVIPESAIAAADAKRRSFSPEHVRRKRIFTL